MGMFDFLKSSKTLAADYERDKKLAADYETEIADIDKKLKEIKKAKDEEYNRAAESTDNAAFANLFVADVTGVGPASTQYVELNNRKTQIEVCLHEVRQRINMKK